MTTIISAMQAADWPQVARIYQEGIDTGQATFALHPPASWEEWSQGKINACSLVARVDDAPFRNGAIAGWAAASPASSRCVYAGIAEVSVYVGASARGRGVGNALLRALIQATEAGGIWTLQAGIFPQNTASLHLHKKHGFRQVGIRERLGKMQHGQYAGQWRDVVLLERRSTLVGV
ncbi:MAG: N-acetyltransferase [Thermoflexales bacterium]|nr:N-acetyltransferase [Thermoflexales bacterium]